MIRAPSSANIIAKNRYFAINTRRHLSAKNRLRRPSRRIGIIADAAWNRLFCASDAPTGDLLGPAEFLQSPVGVPDLGHVADLAVLELHHIDVVAAGAFAGWGQRAAVGAVGA